MLRKFTLAFAMVALALSVLAPSAFATYTQNLAGRPIGGDAATSCQGLAYGIVNDRPVLFFAAHCNPAGGGVAVNGPSGNLLGYTATTYEDGDANQWDLSFIWLNGGEWPSNPDQIYRGFNDWFTILQPNGNSNYDCGSIAGYYGEGVYQSWQVSNTGSTAARFGHITGRAYMNNIWCDVQTDLFWHTSAYKDSGSPFILARAEGTVFGVATGRDGNNNLIVTPVTDGIRSLSTYWRNRGAQIGAEFCPDSSCGGKMP